MMSRVPASKSAAAKRKRIGCNIFWSLLNSTDEFLEGESATNVDSTDGDMFLHYVQLSKTACMLLSVPGSSAQSERGVGCLRRMAVAARNMLSEKALEQKVVCSHFINTDFYSFSTLLKRLEKSNLI